MDLKTGRKKEDTSYVYWLPYAGYKIFLLIQASDNKMSVLAHELLTKVN
ncbi:hypothetical protein [Paraflavitalea speifideaquila]|nr:hypothetical protein [Paraflavitalea speifideiaquila]